VNFVLILSDQQCKFMVGAYGRKEFDTPNLDRLAARGMRFERAYTASPVCTAARAALLTGVTPQLAGAWANEMAPARHTPLLGEIFRDLGWRAAYTGKWHLDGACYEGTGLASGGFEQEWWYDRANLLRDLPGGLWETCAKARSGADLRAAGLRLEHLHGHRVADRAVDFLQRAGDEPFVLVVSFDEPHSPWLAPPEYWEKFKVGDFAPRPNYGASLEGKPEIQRVHAREIAADHGNPTWEQLLAKRLACFGCNSWLDREVGRVLDAVERHHPEDTFILYTSDHGDQLGSHGLHDKGAAMYEESCNVPLLVRGPGVPRGATTQALASHLDLLPTMLELAGFTPPASLHGRSLVPVLRDPEVRVNEEVLISFNRFALGHARGAFFPIRCLTDGRYKLAINLFDTDEFYDLEADPWERVNLIHDPGAAAARDRLHDRLLRFLGETFDPMDSHLWGRRPWRTVRELYYVNRAGDGRARPAGFPRRAR
jgi:uncharacterized sulfatase